MRYTSALVLGTLAAGQAAASNIRHAGFHARRHAEKRAADAPVDWAHVAYDLKDVDWSTINWSSVFASSTPAPTPSSEPKPQVQEYKPAVTSSSAPPAYTPPPAASSTKEAAKPTQTQTSSGGYGNVDSMIQGAETVFKRLNVEGYTNAKNLKNPTGDAWIDESGSAQWRTEFINDSGDDVMVTCWSAAGFTGMCINKYQPPIGVLLPKNGGTINIGFAAGNGMACAGVYPSTGLADFGGVKNTLYEVTFGSTGAFDVSREVFLGGNNISAQGSKCKADMETCVFKCSNGASTCTTGYELQNCGAAIGGGTGTDSTGAASGGCAMGHSGEKVTVTFS